MDAYFPHVKDTKNETFTSIVLCFTQTTAKNSTGLLKHEIHVHGRWCNNTSYVYQNLPKQRHKYWYRCILILIRLCKILPILCNLFFFKSNWNHKVRKPSEWIMTSCRSLEDCLHDLRITILCSTILTTASWYYKEMDFNFMAI